MMARAERGTMSLERAPIDVGAICRSAGGAARSHTPIGSRFRPHP
jgi:hypothetical protein